jgi:vanillate O-demethylase ferredoxin subunit
MLEAVKRAWQNAARPAPDLRYETFGNSGRFATQAFQVKVPRHGLEITVDAGRSLLEALESAGVACLSDCRRGECGLCVTSVLGVDGELDHRDVFLSEHEKQSNTQMCICVSRAVGRVTLDSAFRPD